MGQNVCTEKRTFDIGERTNARLWSISTDKASRRSVSITTTVLSRFPTSFPTHIIENQWGPSILVTPVSLDEIGSISRHASQEALSPKHPDRSPISHRPFPAQANLHMSDAQREQRRHGITQHRPVGAIELRDGGKNERERHVLKEVQMAAALEEQRIRVVGGAGGVVLVVRVVEMAADPLLVFDALVDDAVAEEEEVGGEGEGPGAGDGFLRSGGSADECDWGFCDGDWQNSRSILGTGTPSPIVELMLRVVGDLLGFALAL